MAKRLFSFDVSSSDEPEFFARLMEENNIEYYVVPGSAFGLSKPGFWIKHDADFVQAKELFKTHEQAFAQLAREKYQRETGYNPDAKGVEKLHFTVSHLAKKKKMVLWVLITLGLMIIFFIKFFSALLQ